MSSMPLIAIVGPTASGKTAAALQIARRHDGEIICADSRTIYRGMDIGTAKPSAEEQTQVPHHFLDILAPDQPYAAAFFKADCDRVITEIQARGRLPIIVGGTGLYVWSVMYDYQFPAGPSSSQRKLLEGLGTEELAQRLQQADPERAANIDLKNPRRIIRALETVGQPRVAPKSLRPDQVIIGINPPMEVLEARILQRTKQMLVDGLIEEVRGLIERYNPVIEPLNTVGYRETIDFLDEKIGTEAELVRLISLHTRQLAKRQLTWFKRNSDIQWVETTEAAIRLGSQYLKARSKR